jgi:hypothetical protein
MRDHAQAKPAHGPTTPTPPPPVLPRFDPNLSNRAQRVLWALTEWAWGRKPYCYPSVKTIAEACGYCKRTIGLAVKELEAKGYISTHYNRSNVGRYRVIVILGRVPTPTLHMVDPQVDPRALPSDDRQRGGAKTGGGGAKGCATPAQSVAPPMAQSVAPKELSSNPQGEDKKNSEAATSPKEEGSPPRRGNDRTQADDQPDWLRVDNLTAADLAFWREILHGPPHPMRRIAAKILDRYNREHAGMEEEGRPRPSDQRTTEADPRDESDASVHGHRTGTDHPGQLE